MGYDDDDHHLLDLDLDLDLGGWSEEEVDMMGSMDGTVAAAILFGGPEANDAVDDDGHHPRSTDRRCHRAQHSDDCDAASSSSSSSSSRPRSPSLFGYARDAVRTWTSGNVVGLHLLSRSSSSSTTTCTSFSSSSSSSFQDATVVVDPRTAPATATGRVDARRRVVIVERDAEYDSSPPGMIPSEEEEEEEEESEGSDESESSSPIDDREEDEDDMTMMDAMSDASSESSESSSSSYSSTGDANDDGPIADPAAVPGPALPPAVHPCHRGVTFNEQVRVLPIPHIGEYTSEQIRRMYANRFEVRENKLRNKREYEFDNYDWRNATEECSMAVCPRSGELLHPAHL